MSSVDAISSALFFRGRSKYPWWNAALSASACLSVSDPISPGSASNGTQSQRDRVQQVYEFVDRNGPVEPATVADELELSSDVVRHDIDNLKHSGDLYSPDGDEVETT